MRTKKINFLMENGLPSKFLINLSDKQVSVLYSRYISEQSTQPINTTKTTKTVDTYTVKPNSKTSINGFEVDTTGGTTKITSMKENELDEDDTLNVVNDPDATEDGMGIFETKKKSKYNPWAICTSQLGKEFKTTERSEWSPKQKAKYERCVKDVKSSIKEGKDPYETLLENHILALVESKVRPGMTKQEIINTVKEQIQMVSSKKLDKPVGKSYLYKKFNPMEQAEPTVKPRTAPPKTKPGVKPNRPNPYQPPKESPKEKPKAQDYKSMFISTLNQLLGK
jgi:hypothetical protein